MCRSFARLGHEVCLMSPDMAEGRETTDLDPFSFYGVEPDFQIQILRSARWSPFLYPFDVLARTVLDKPDILFGRSLPAVMLAARWGFPVAFELHCSYPTGSMHDRIIRSIASRRNLLGVVVISQALKDYVVATYGCNPDKVLVAHDGADAIDKVTPVVYEGSFALNVGYVGHLYEGRGVDVILSVAERMPDVCFHLVGGMSEDIQRWKDCAKDRVNVVFHGFIEPSRVSSYQISFDILLAPYQEKVFVYGTDADTSKWMSPLKVFEYMASGVPMVVSDLPVLREVLENDHNAILCHPQVVGQWIDAIDSLRDPELRLRLSANAQRDFMAHYTWDRRAENILFFLRDQLNGTRTGHGDA
jgi:glycosyltransferase involved in cell wall biosynthesis